jgi:hypothetical protein
MKPYLLSIASVAVLGLLCNPLLAQSDSIAILAGAQPVFNPATEPHSALPGLPGGCRRVDRDLGETDLHN